jgi:hypothetical protein
MYNKSEIMNNAWTLYRAGGGAFSEALRRAWAAAFIAALEFGTAATDGMTRPRPLPVTNPAFNGDVRRMAEAMRREGGCPAA